MEDEDSTRPSIGFPLGLGLLFFMLLFMSGLFTCCLQWDKLRSLLGASNDENSHVQVDIDHPPRKPSPPRTKSKPNHDQSLPVLMPGDEIPKFIAIACPREPPRLVIEKITVSEQKPPTFPFPLY